MAQAERTVLVVDDNQDIRNLVGHFLGSDGYLVFTASDGDEALAILNNNVINLVLLDVMMPGKSGIDVLKEIRNGSNKKNREIPVMMITAKSTTEDIDEALLHGANSYIIKPFRGHLIREKVEAFFTPATNQ